MWVIKLGGSIAEAPVLRRWLEFCAEQQATGIVIVPGGGCFAELVRQQQKRQRFNDEIAHAMAIKAMQQMALLFQGLNKRLLIADCLKDIQQALAKNATPVWSPDINWLKQHKIPMSWDVTSDSLAAFLARELAATRLILVKSAELPAEGSITQLVNCGIVDKAFLRYSVNTKFEVSVIQRDNLNSLKALLKQS